MVQTKIILVWKSICFKAIQNDGNPNSAGDLDSGLSSNFCWSRNANYVKITEGFVMCKGWPILIQKCLQTRKILVFHCWPKRKRQSMEWNYTNSPVKKKELGVAVSKENRRKGMEGPLAADLLKNFAIVNSVSNCENLRKTSPSFIE